MAYNFLGLVNAINRRLNEVELTSSNFATATGFYSQAKDAVNAAIRYLNQSEYFWAFNHNTKEQTLSVAFTTRPKAEIDDLVKFFEDLGGVTKFRFDLEDSNEGSNEESIFCVCDNWNQTWAYDNFYSLQATFRRVYEA